MKIILRLAAITAALSAGLCVAAPASRASTYGDAPWCVITSGGDEARWNCAYRTAQDCVQALASAIGRVAAVRAAEAGIFGAPRIVLRMRRRSG